MSTDDWPTRVAGAEETLANGHVLLAFDRECITVYIEAIVPLKKLREGVHQSRKYAQIVSSIKAIGLVEAPVIIPDPQKHNSYFLLDGHLRIEALKELGVPEVECLIGRGDETYACNKRINRLPPVQEHRMIARAMERGVPQEKIADALGLEVQSVRKRFRLLEGGCAEVAETLKETNCSMKVFDVLRRMSTLRQIEAADLMIGQNNFTFLFARALLAATPEDQLTKPPSKKNVAASHPNRQQIARMERELAVLQTRVKSVEDSYGIDNLHLTLARGYLVKLLGNAPTVRWLSHHRQEYLAKFQRVAEVDTLAGVSEPT